MSAFKTGALAALAIIFLVAGSGVAQEKGDTGLTGAVSEEEFVKLHELKGEQAPAPRGQMLEIKGTKAYLSLPKNAKAPLPAIVVIHEWWGLNRNIKHWSDRLAADGYAALAVDLYGGKVATKPRQAMGFMGSVKKEAALKTLLDAYSFLATDERIKARRRACVGWCFGGGWSLQLALNAPDLDGAVIYYGRLVTDAERLSVIGEKTRILGVFANKDRSIPPPVVNEFEKALKTAGRQVAIHRYDAPHAFANPSSARYDHKAAADAWKKVRAFFASVLRKP